MSEARLRDRIDYLEAEVAFYKDMLAVPTDAIFIATARAKLRITPRAARVLHILTFSKRTSKEAMHHAYTNGAESAEDDEKIIDVQVYHVRKALKPHGIDVETIWGDGYRMTPEAKAAVLALLGIEAKP